MYLFIKMPGRLAGAGQQFMVYGYSLMHFELISKTKTKIIIKLLNSALYLRYGLVEGKCIR